MRKKTYMEKKKHIYIKTYEKKKHLKKKNMWKKTYRKFPFFGNPTQNVSIMSSIKISFFGNFNLK